MEGQTNKELTHLRHALKAMSKALNQALYTDTYEGTGDLLVRNYQRLHAKATQIMPDDYFIETFSLDDLSADLDDRQKVGQVQLMVNQLSNYINGLLKEDDFRSLDVDDLRNLGGELRDQIIRMTKNTLKNALSNIDFDVKDDKGDEEVQRPHKIKIKIEREKDDPDSETR